MILHSIHLARVLAQPGEGARVEISKHRVRISQDNESQDRDGADHRLPLGPILAAFDVVVHPVPEVGESCQRASDRHNFDNRECSTEGFCEFAVPFVGVQNVFEPDIQDRRQHTHVHDVFVDLHAITKECIRVERHLESQREEPDERIGEVLGVDESSDEHGRRHGLANKCESVLVETWSNGQSGIDNQEPESRERHVVVEKPTRAHHIRQSHRQKIRTNHDICHSAE